MHTERHVALDMQPNSCIMNMQSFDCMNQEECNMYDIRHRIGLEASLGAVYEQIATTDGLTQWWTSDTRGQSAVGDKVSFHFGDKGFMTMEVAELEADRRVGWRCI